MESVYTLPGAGDLYVTSQGGRNGRLGRLIGRGVSYSQARLQMPGETVEGAELLIAIAPTLKSLLSTHRLDSDRLPLLAALADIVVNDAPVVIPWDRFFSGAPAGVIEI